MRIEQLKLTPAGVNGSTISEKKSETEIKPFAELLADALQEVNRQQKQAEQASINLAAGKVQDISEVVIAAEKAAISLQLTMQVRNKIIDAYQEVMRMQV